MTDERSGSKKCAVCGRPVGTMAFTCRHCSKIHCQEHRMPENHKCTGNYRVSPLHEPDPRLKQPVSIHNISTSEKPSRFDEAAFKSRYPPNPDAGTLPDGTPVYLKKISFTMGPSAYVPVPNDDPQLVHAMDLVDQGQLAQ